MRFLRQIIFANIAICLSGCAGGRLHIRDHETNEPVANAFVCVDEYKMFSPFNGSNIYVADK